MTAPRVIFSILALLLISQTISSAQDFSAIIEVVDKMEVAGHRLTAEESAVNRPQRQDSQVESDRSPIELLEQRLQILETEVARLSALSIQPSISESDMVAMAGDIAWLKTELAAGRSPINEEQKILASLNEEYHPSSSAGDRPLAAEPPLHPDFLLSGFVDASHYSNHHERTSSFGLDQVEVDVIKQFANRVSVRADIECLNDGQGGFDFDLEQGYVEWFAGDDWVWQVTFGKINAPIGFEGADPVDMYQYSAGLLGSYCTPGNVTGAMITLAAPKALSWSMYVVNGWDVNTDNNNGKTFGTRVGFALRDNLSVGLSALTGPEQDDNIRSRRSVLDCDVTYKPLSFWTVGGEINYGWESKILAEAGTARWHGLLLMSNVQITPRYGITGRMDYLNDHDGTRTEKAQERKSICLSPTAKIADGLTGLVEVRYDWSNRDSFIDADDTAGRERVSTAVEFTYAL